MSRNPNYPQGDEPDGINNPGQPPDGNDPSGSDYLTGPVYPRWGSGSKRPSSRPEQNGPSDPPSRPAGGQPPQSNNVPRSPYRPDPNATPEQPKRTPQYLPPAKKYQSYQPAYPPQVPSDRAFMGQPAKAPASRGGGCRRFLVFAVIALFLLAALTLMAGCGAYVAVAAGLPPASQLSAANLSQSTKIYDRNGQLLYEVFDPNSANGGKRTVVPPEQIPDVLKKATIDTEDPSFYSNPGVDWYGIARAIYYDVRYQRVISGASTITQQLVRNTLITPEPTVQRKIREAVLAMEVTRRYSKDQILAMYLNAIYYGNLSYGIQAASQSYFGKDVSKLDLAEATLLAGLPQAPAVYDPCNNPDAALGRQKVVLDLMQKRGDVTDQQATASEQEMAQVLHSDAFAKHCDAPQRIMTAPHFVYYILQQLEQQYGQEVVYNGGLQVYTTLDPTLQAIVQAEASKQIAALQANNVKSAAVVATNPQTGEILAMIGSVNFNDKNIDGQVNVATSLRQPGSSIKPINYVTALEKGWTPATPILDLITPFPNGGGAPYVPTNYDGKEHGIVSVRTALGNSLNIPAVKTLYFVTVPNMIATAQKMGITSFSDPSRYGLALTLGGGEVKLTELTNAYSVFADQGKYVPMTPYLKIVDGQGNTIVDNTKNKPAGQQVMDARYAYQMTSILSDNAARALEFGANSPLKTSRPTFAKTGTTNDFKDNWTLGGTTELVVGVWVGDPRNTAMKNVSGIAGAAPIWHNVIERAYKEDKLFSGVAPHDFPIPQGLVRATVCNESGLLPTELCPPDHRHQEIFLAEQAPNKPDNVWVKVKIDKRNGMLANDQCPADQVEEKVFEKMPQDPVLPYDQVVKWANEHGIPQPPQQQSNCEAQPTQAPSTNQVKITAPKNGDVVKGIVTIEGSADVPNFDHYTVEFGQNGEWGQIANRNTVVDNGELAQGDTTPLADGPYTVRLSVYDKNGGVRQDQVQVTVQNLPVTPTETATPEGTRTPRPTRTPPGGISNGPGTYEDNNPAIAYSRDWQTRSDPSLSGGTVHYSTRQGATATLAVTGASSFTLTFYSGPNFGTAKVLVDGNEVGTINTSTPTTGDATSPPIQLLDTGNHTITIQAASNTAIVLDFITVNGP